MLVRILFLLGTLLLIASCATLSKDECRAGDWQAIGLEDGAKGRLTSFFDKHVKACAKHEVAPERS